MLADHNAIPVLAVTDLERARAFYEGTLRLTSVGDVPEGVMYGTANGGLLVYPSAYAGTNKATGISFQVPESVFADEIAALRSAGVTFQTFDVPADYGTWNDGVLSGGGMTAVWFADPDGNVLNVESHSG